VPFVAPTTGRRDQQAMTLHIRIAGYQGERSVHTRAVRVMIDALLKQADGQVSVGFESDITERGCKATDLLDLVKSGDLDLCYFSSGYLTRHAPALGVFDIPFQFADRPGTRLLLEGHLGAILRQEVAARTEYEVLAFWDNGLRNISNARRPIRSPGDCAGIRIRTLPNAGYHDTFRALGMEPVTIDVSDMVQAIASGAVDAQENPLANIELFGLQKYHPFVTMTGHFQGIVLLLCNAKRLAGWPETMRTILRAAVHEGTAAQWQLAADEEVASRSALEAKGIDIVDIDDAGRTAFKEAVRVVIERGYADLPEAVLQAARSSPA
jgi:TRAP-type C4-dicarboxylate transport system substrate-binding protein